MRLLRSIPVIALLFAATTAELLAQQDPVVTTGARVRVSAPDLAIHEMTGTVDALQGDTLVINAGDGSAPTVLTVPALSRLELSLGIHSRKGRGAAIGFLSGAVVGAVIGYAVGDDSCSSGGGFGPDFCVDKTGAAVLLGVGGALFGAGVGAIIGNQFKSERWREVPLDKLQLGAGPGAASGLALWLSLPTD